MLSAGLAKTGQEFRLSCGGSTIFEHFRRQEFRLSCGRVSQKSGPEFRLSSGGATLFCLGSQEIRLCCRPISAILDNLESPIVILSEIFRDFPRFSVSCMFFFRDFPRFSVNFPRFSVSQIFSNLDFGLQISRLLVPRH